MEFDCSQLDEGLGNDILDDDLEYDVDLLKEEREYYERRSAEQIQDIEKVGSARVWNSPVPHTEKNTARKSTVVYKISEKALALKNLHKVELLRYRACGEQYLLNKERLLFHILAFVDLPRDVPSPYEDPPFYSVGNDKIIVDPNYRFKYDDLWFHHTVDFLANLAYPYLATHIELREITNFVERIESSTCVPAFWQEFVSYIRKFFVDYGNVISTLRKQDGISVIALVEKTKPLRDCVELLYSLCSAWLETYMFDWVQVELAWNIFFIVLDDSSVMSEDEKIMVAQLQDRYNHLLLRIMDQIYSLGKVPRQHEDFFILYNDPSDPELLSTRSSPHVVSLLWSDDLLLTVLRGARARFRLDDLDQDVAPVFSEAFYRHLRTLTKGNEVIVPFQDFKRAFKFTAQELTHELSKKLLLQIRAASFQEYWQDMKEVTCGRIAHCFAGCVYGCMSDPSKVTVHITDLYKTVLHRSGIPLERTKNWKLARTSTSETDYMISCELEKPLSYVFRPTLLATMNACMDNVFKLFRVIELLTSVSSDRKTDKDYGQVNENRRTAERRVRHLCFIVSKLLLLVSVIKDLFVGKVTAIFERAAGVLEKAEEVEEVDEILSRAEAELQALMARTNIRRQFHEIVDILKKLAEEIRLKSVSNDLNSSSLLKWHKATVAAVEFLSSIGAAMPNDSIFYALFVRLKYQRENVRYPAEEVD